ncbi:AfsR/SARP family transcriptional regulator [Streptomyces mayteni]
MDIRLLGPLEVLADDGTPLPVTAPNLRTALAALALRAGQVVRIEELAEQLWGTEPPPSAAATLRNYVMRLRRIVPGERITTESGGYRLRADRSETDLGRFEEGVRLSRALSAEEPARAAALLERALGLWRGVPLCDLSDSPLRAFEQPRLEGVRLSALEERFELMLALGEQTIIVDEVVAAARTHHLREGFTRQAMVALHRCGRTPEALAAYRETRERLVEELGIEPSAALRALEAALLRDEPDPAPPTRPAASVTATATSASAVFPPSTTTFVARGLELARLRGWLGDAAVAPAVCLIDGPGGVGKSALAVRAAREVADRFPDGLLYVDLRGADPRDPPLDVTEALARLLAALGTPSKAIPPEPAAAAAFYQERLRGRRVLVLLDNALDAARVAPLLPEEPGSAALVTSRLALTGVRGGHHLHLTTLTTAEAVTLVRTVAGDAGSGAAPGEWAKLVGQCGHLPLALRIIAARMAARPRWRVGDWTAVLDDERSRMDELTADDVDLRASLMVSIDQLAAGTDPAGRRAAEIFPLLGAVAVRSFGTDTVAALADCQEAEARAALERLTDAQIAASPRPGVYVPHDLVRSAAAWQAARLPARPRDARVAGLARWYLGSLHRVNTPLALQRRYDTRYRAGAERYPVGREFGSVDESLPWADEVLEDVLCLAEQLSAPEYDDAEQQLGERPLSAFSLEAVQALESYFAMRLAWRAQRLLCEITLTVGRRRADRFAQAVAYAQLGKVAGQQGRGAEGLDLLERSIELYRATGEETEAVAASLNLVPCLGSMGRLTEAVAVAERTLADAVAAGIEEMRPQLVNNLGRCHLFLGDHAAALRLLTSNYETATLPYERTMCASVLVEYHLEVEEFEKALHWSDLALRHASEQPFDPFVMAQQRTWLATALRGLGREDAARAQETRAREVLDDLNSRENSHLRARVTRKISLI